MNKYFTIITTLLFAPRASQAADEAGWNKAQWGMTPQQIAQAYPEARALAKPEDFKLVGENFIAPLGIDRFDLAGGIYKVRFLMDAKNTLGGVILARDSQFNLTAEANTLEKLLIQKYGPFSDVKETNGRSVAWSRQGVTITLNNIVEPTIQLYGIRLIYLRPNTKSLDKL